MAHGTRINGTSYGITGGKCLVNGTEYGIKKGRTLVDGTGYDISFGPELLSNFSDNSWENIIWACKNRAVPDSWKDDGTSHKSLTIGGAPYQIDIIGKNHDLYTDGSVAPLTFQVHEVYSKQYSMNDSQTNVGGYRASAMHNTHLPSVLSSIPAEIQNAIRSVKKSCSIGGTSTEIEEVPCDLFLFSISELLGDQDRYCIQGEGKQYAYFERNGVIKDTPMGQFGNGYWTRTPTTYFPSGFIHIDYRGVSGMQGATVAASASFGFCF